MPDLLIVSANLQLTTVLEEVGVRKNFRTKSALDTEGAVEWLKNKGFDAVCIDTEVSISNQERIADALWRGNPAAPFVIVDPYESGGARMEERLFGADVVRGAAGMLTLSKLLDEIRPLGELALSGFSIMVVDDLDSPRDIICTFVESMGFGKVTGVRSVHDALVQLTADPAGCSCIITDIKMPELSGQDLIEQVRKHSKLQHLPIIVLTAYGSADTLLACLNAGASGFLAKPPKRSDLARELGRAFRISLRQASPRLASPNEVEQLRIALEKRGFS